jgi:plastocyanin
MLQLSTAKGALARLAFVALFVTTAQAQQFQRQIGAIPGPTRWSEGVEAVDVDNDGDLDLLFADGDGFSTPGAQRQNVLIINKLIETGPGIYVDESVARLGVHLSNAKGVCTGDVNGDGWVDLLFANAFNTDTPFLYINQGPASPGFFTMESATRGLTTAYSSAGAQFGDLDSDGDLDLIIADSGASFLGGAGDRPHLFMNDGDGNFTENAAGLAAPIKAAHMDVQLADVDNDFDLDFLGACRATNAGGNHFMLLNNSAASFTNSSSVVPGGSSNVYEIELGDLDDDNDLDLFYVSISGFSEGAARNNLIGTGTFGFTSQGGLPGFVDDNEIVMMDYDMDGDYDQFVGSLGATESLWRNNGSFSFTNTTAGTIQTVSDPTLDMTAADLDNDGDYDLITSQGEGNPGAYENKIYLNSGPADVRAPRATRIRTIPASFPDPVRVLAQVRDEMMDDSVQYVTGFARYVVNSSPQSAAVTVDGGGFTPSAITVPAGTTVTWTHGGGGAQSVTSTTAPYEYDSGSFSSGSYSYTFVSPGVYTYTSTPSGSNGTVTVTGTAGEKDGLYAGGGMHFFALPSNGAQVCYELWFSDWHGNESVSDSFCRSLSNPFPTFCDNSDGSLASCPCGNAGNPNTGCDIQQSTGGVELVVDTQETSPLNRVTATGVGFPVMSTPTAIIIRGAALDTGSPVVFGDGLRCVGVPLVRLGATFANAGTATHTFGHGAMAGTGTFYYQIWFRNTPVMFCDPVAAFNLSNGREIDW